MTQLRQAMIRAMELKNLSKNTQRAYLAAVSGLAKHYQQSPVKIADKMIEDYLLRNSKMGTLVLKRFYLLTTLF